MIRGIGLDAADVVRTAGLVDRYGERFTRRVYTAAERDYCERRRDRAQSYAARFAAKEAVMKALGSGWGKVRFCEIEVVMDRSGRPGIDLHGGAAARASELGVGSIHLSLTHERGLALAAAVAESFS